MEILGKGKTPEQVKKDRLRRRTELLNKHAQTDPLIMPILEFDTLLVVNSIFGSVWRLVRWWVWFSITTKFYYYWHKRKEKEEDLEKL